MQLLYAVGDISTEVLTLCSQAAIPVGPIAGLATKIVTLQNELAIQMAPGEFMMPDGTIVEETENVIIPMLNIDSTSTWTGTLMAYKTIVAGAVSSEVTYRIVPGKLIRSTMDQDTIYCRTPLAWITKLPGASASSFKCDDLGSRDYFNLKTETFLAPFQNLAPHSCVLDGSDLVAQIQPGKAYLQLPPDENHSLVNVQIYGRCKQVNQTVKFNGLKEPTTLTTPGSKLASQATFGTTFSCHILEYSTACLNKSDLIQISCDSIFEIREIVTTRLRIF